MRHRWARAVSPPLIACVDSTCKRHALVMPVHTRWHAVLDKPCCLPTACASPCAPSRQAAEASCPTAVPPLVHTFFPSACGQRVGASARAGAVPAAVCSGCALRCPRQGCQPQRGGRQPWLAYERFPKDTGPRRSQRTSMPANVGWRWKEEQCPHATGFSTSKSSCLEAFDER